MASITQRRRSCAVRREPTVATGRECPGEISAEELRQLLLTDDGKRVTVVDVRPSEAHGGKASIHGSVSYPYPESDLAHLVKAVRQQELATLPARHVTVFVSDVSPDLDDIAARTFIQEYEKAQGELPAQSSVCILLGGLCMYSATSSAPL